jgi:hypothetical protein
MTRTIRDALPNLPGLIGMVTWLVLFAIMIAVALIAGASARSEFPRDAFTCRAYRADLYWHRWAREHCPGYRHKTWRRRWTAPRHAVPREPTCHALVPAIGEQAQSEASAWDAAIVAWRGRVRWLHGERFSDHNAARDLVKACAPSSVPDAYRDAKLPQLYRCEVVARPCRAPPQRIGKGDDD